MYDTDRLILTGAGASIPVGIPGMRGMAREFRESLDEGTETKEAYDKLTEWGASDDLEELLQLCDDINQFNNGPLENFTESCVSPRGGVKKLRDFRKRTVHNINIIESFRDRLVSYISNKCLSFDRKKARALYSDIIRVSSNRNIPIYTTNYDPVIEHTAERERINVVDNFIKTEYDREFWDETLNSFKGDGIQIVHIHGSVQWHTNRDGSVEKLPQPANINREGQQLRQLLIFPTEFKDIYRQNYFPLYTSFTRTLGQAKTLFVIGHSLRDQYLLAAIRERLQDPEFLLVVLDPSFTARDQLIPKEDSKRKDRIVHVGRRFEKIQPLLLQAINDYPIGNLKSLFRESTKKLKHGTKDKIKIKDCPQWVDPGEEIKIKFNIDTIIGGGKLKLYLCRKNYYSKKENIKYDIVNSDFTKTIGLSNQPVSGNHDKYMIISFNIPDDISREYSHKVILTLEGNKNGTCKDRRILRIRKN